MVVSVPCPENIVHSLQLPCTVLYRTPTNYALRRVLRRCRFCPSIYTDFSPVMRIGAFRQIHAFRTGNWPEVFYGVFCIAQAQHPLLGAVLLEQTSKPFLHSKPACTGPMLSPNTMKQDSNFVPIQMSYTTFKCANTCEGTPHLVPDFGMSTFAKNCRKSRIVSEQNATTVSKVSSVRISCTVHTCTSAKVRMGRMGRIPNRTS